MFVKVCGLSTPESVREAVDASADAVGFVLTTSPREVSPDQVRILLPLVPAGVHAVGVFRHEAAADRKTLIVCVASALVVGVYDGFYGPGTGTFLIIAFTVFAGMTVGAANAQAKVINLATNLSALAVFLAEGQVLVPLGLAAAVCNMAGNYLGSGLALTKGARIVRPVILAVLLLLFLKIIIGF